jgi:hypothetical protein
VERWRGYLSRATGPRQNEGEAVGLTRQRMVTGVFRGAAIGAVAAALLSGSAAPAGAATSPNLILNGNAEAGPGTTNNTSVPVPDWKVPSGGTFTAVQWGSNGGPTATDPGPPDRAVNYFAGGCITACTGIPYSQNAVEKATQNISLSAYVTKIKTGTVTFTSSGWFGGFLAQDDHAVLKIKWKDAHGAVIGSATSVGGVLAADRGNATGLLFRTKSAAVPAAARSAKVQIICTKGAPTTNNWYNDGYADDLSLVLNGV